MTMCGGNLQNQPYTKDYKSTGRPSYDSLILFKLELLRTWYCFSDGEVEEQVNDRLSFSRFVGLGLEDTAPESTAENSEAEQLARFQIVTRLVLLIW